MAILEHDKYYHIYNRGNNREDLFHGVGDYEKFLRLYEKYINPIADTFAWVLMKNHFHLLVRIKGEEEIGFYLSLNPDGEAGSNDSVRFNTTENNNMTESDSNNLTESEGPVRVVIDDIESEGPVRVVIDDIESEGPVRVVIDNNSSFNSDRSVDSVRLKPYSSSNSDRSDDSVRLKSNSSTNSDRSGDAVRLLRRPNPTLHFSHLFNAYARYYNLKYERTGTLFERPFKRIEIGSNEYMKRLVVYIHTNPVHHGFTDDFINYPWSSYQSIISSEPTKLKRDDVIYWFNDIENLKYMHQMKMETELFSDILLE